MAKSGASNSDKTEVRRRWEDGKTVDQAAVLCNLQRKHVEAIYARLEETGKLLYTTGKAKAGSDNFQKGDVGEVRNVSDSQAQAQLAKESQDKIEDLQRQLAEAKQEDEPQPKRRGRPPKST